MIRPILLDTRALLWLANGDDLAAAALDALAEAEQQEDGVLVSPIAAWELGQLVASGRVALPMDPLSWFDAALNAGVALAPMPHGVLVNASFQPGLRATDPAAQVVVATARAFGFRVMTRDPQLLEFAREGHLQTVAC